jgi:hypothetical protein
MSGIQHFLNKGEGDYTFFRVFDPPPIEKNNNSNCNNPIFNGKCTFDVEKQPTGESVSTVNEEDNEVVVIAATPELTRQVFMDNCPDSEWLYADWNVRGILPSPMRLVMFRPSMCQLCGVVDADVGHTQFYTGHVYEHTGFNFCCHCKDKFFSVLKARAEPIWELLQCDTLLEFWAPRTRRDPVTNERLYSGKYKYEKWRAVSKYVSYSVDNTKGMPGTENAPFICCEMNDAVVGEISKSIPISDILKSNYNACKNGFFDTSYDPNDDDPINTLELADDAKIVLSKVHSVQQ